jgi:hypothetical protein
MCWWVRRIGLSGLVGGGARRGAGGVMVGGEGAAGGQAEQRASGSPGGGEVGASNWVLCEGAAAELLPRATATEPGRYFMPVSLA